MTLLLNFAHPFTDEQLAQLITLLGVTPRVRDVSSHVDRSRPLAEVARELAGSAALTATEWQTIPLVINPPSLAPVALTLLAELHGRCGYFPPIVNIRPVSDVIPPRYEVAEIVNLQALRDEARRRRDS